MPNCKICGRPILECDMSVCRKCRNGERSTPLNLLRTVVKNITKSKSWNNFSLKTSFFVNKLEV